MYFPKPSGGIFSKRSGCCTIFLSRVQFGLLSFESMFAYMDV